MNFFDQAKMRVAKLCVPSGHVVVTVAEHEQLKKHQAPPERVVTLVGRVSVVPHIGEAQDVAAIRAGVLARESCGTQAARYAGTARLVDTDMVAELMVLRP